MKSFVFAGIAERGGDGFGLYFPDLPGCVTAAATIEQLVANAREALALHLTGMVEDGLSIPQATPAQDLVHDPEVDEVGIMLVDVSLDGPAVASIVNLPVRLLARVDEAAQAKGVTRSDIIAEGAERFLKAG